MNKAYIVDIGNSLTKIAYVDLKTKNIIFLNAYGTKKIFFWNSKIKKDFDFDVKSKIYIASISPTALKNFLNLIDNKNLIVFIKNEMFSKIISKKFNLNEIGVDILASSYRAQNLYKRSLLISCGTAIFAALNINSKLQGVIIMPSIIKAFESLNKNCELIDNYNISNFNKNFGFNTDSSISGGYFHMLNGTFKSLIYHAHEEHKVDKVIICGGNHKNIKKLSFLKEFSFDFSDPHLVISGIIDLINDFNI